MNRDSITEWFRERKPAFIIGNPQCRTNEHIRWCCDLYKLQAQEGRSFGHEQPANAAAWKLECIKESEGLCDSDFGPKYGNRLLLTAAHARGSRVSVGVEMNKCVRTLEEGNSVRVVTNSKG